MIVFIDDNDPPEDFNNPRPVPFVNCLANGLVVVVDDIGDGGERLVSFELLPLVDVKLVNSERSDAAEVLVLDEVVPVVHSVVFLSLNPVARDAHPFAL